MRKVGLAGLLVLMACIGSQAQIDTQHMSAGIGFTHMTGDFGPDGFEGSVAVHPNRWLSLAGEVSALWSTVRTNDIKVTDRIQNYQAGPRVHFYRAFANPKWVPFAHLLFGVSHQSTSIQNGPEASDTSYSWSLGGGTDYDFNRKVSGRLKAEFLRTTFESIGRTRGRFTVGIMYHFGGGIRRGRIPVTTP
ncbi:MAG TPA: outer membrane beta-barrel protein [Clostridia bacterium]|nr:outer membrane beta-barrel protein [Clostridia bacterium]